jgi:hypothetical protein
MLTAADSSRASSQGTSIAFVFVCTSQLNSSRRSCLLCSYGTIPVRSHLLHEAAQLPSSSPIL